MLRLENPTLIGFMLTDAFLYKPQCFSKTTVENYFFLPPLTSHRIRFSLEPQVWSWSSSVAQWHKCWMRGAKAILSEIKRDFPSSPPTQLRSLNWVRESGQVFTLKWMFCLCICCVFAKLLAAILRCQKGVSQHAPSHLSIQLDEDPFMF